MYVRMYMYVCMYNLHTCHLHVCVLLTLPHVRTYVRAHLRTFAHIFTHMSMWMYCFCVYCCQNCADVVLKDYLERLDNNSGEDDDEDDEAFEPYPTVSVQDYLCVVRTYVRMFLH